MFRSYLVTMMVLSLTATVGGTTYYVSPTGSNGNPGTSLPLAWQTVVYAAQQVNPGDTVLISPGFYLGYVDVKGGTAGNRVTYRGTGASRDDVIISGGGVNAALAFLNDSLLEAEVLLEHAETCDWFQPEPDTPLDCRQSRRGHSPCCP